MRITFLLIIFQGFALTTKGQCLNGDCQNGSGVYQYSNGKYQGEWKNGNRNGIGTYAWDTGNYYYGEWKNGERTGFGYYLWSAGDEYIGEFINGTKEGNGIYIWKDYAMYIGELSDNDFSGLGYKLYKNGNFDFGQWKSDKLVNTDYSGTISFEKSSCILGNCNNGFGIYLAVSGQLYIGNWQNGERNLSGTYYWPNGDKYFGKWTNNERDGEGYFYTGSSIYKETWEKGIKIKSEKLSFSKSSSEYAASGFKMFEEMNKGEKVDFFFLYLANESFDNALFCGNTNPELFFKAGIVKMHLRDYYNAILLFQKALDANYETSKCYLNTGKIRLLLGDKLGGLNCLYQSDEPEVNELLNNL